MEHSDLLWLFCILPLYLIFFCLVAASLPWVPRCRILAFVIYSVFGGIAIDLYSNIRRAQERDVVLQSINVQTSEGINGAVGFLGAVWVLVSAVVTSEVGQNGYSSRRSRGTRCLWVMFIDLVFLVLLITAAALSFTFLPARAGICSTHDVTLSPLFSAIGGAIQESAQGGCKRAVVVQSLGIVVIILMGLQIVLLWPHTVAPAPARALLTLLVGLIRSERGTDVERMGRVSSKKLLSPASHPPPFPEKTHPSTCKGHEKTECWACTKPICNQCKKDRNVRTPRTTGHTANCYAVCTRCYLTRCSVDPASLASIWRSDDLAYQHPSCGLIAPGLSSANEVDLCSDCSGLDSEKVVGLREQKEEALVRVMSARKLRCAKCDVALSKKRRRWWVCGKCEQECHWRGHVPCRR